MIKKYKNEVITFYSGAKLRYRKDGKPDLRYTLGKKEALVKPTSLEKPAKKRSKKRSGLGTLEAIKIGAILGLELGMISALLILCQAFLDIPNRGKFISPLPVNAMEVESLLEFEESEEVQTESEGVVWNGTASYYSEDGCIGCREDLLMANGERFHDEGFTVAFNWLPLGSFVSVENVSNGMVTVAEVTDTGGFTELGRIIDLSPTVKEEIGCNDLCSVVVSIFEEEK